jgi:rubredoxin
MKKAKWICRICRQTGEVEYENLTDYGDLHDIGAALDWQCPECGVGFVEGVITDKHDYQDLTDLEKSLIDKIKTNKIIKGEFSYNLETKQLDFVCHQNAEFNEVKEALVATRDELNRQINDQLRCTYYEKLKGIGVECKNRSDIPKQS